MRKFLLTLCGCAALCSPLAAGAADASSDAPLLPVETFAQPPRYIDAALSPDGKTLAVLSPLFDRKNLVVIDLDTRKATALTGLREADVARMWWVNGNRLLFNYFELDAAGGDRHYGGIQAVDKDGSEIWQGTDTHGVIAPLYPRDITPVGDRTTDLVYVDAVRRTASGVYKLDTRSGKMELMTLGAPSGAERWVIDHAGVVRAAVTSNEDKGAVWYRDGADSPWKEVLLFPRSHEAPWEPLGFDFDNKTMYVAARAGRPHRAIYAFDFQTMQPAGEPLVAVEGFDMAQPKLIFDERAKELAGVSYAADRQRVAWVSPRWAAFQKTIDAALPDHDNWIIGQVGGERVVVLSDSMVDPGTYYLYEAKTRSLTELISRRPDVDPAQMSPGRFMYYKARDGLSIPAYLTIPKGSSGKNLPLIVYVHGGPNVRTDYGRWEAEVQFLASRGYAVIQPEFRGTPGFGFELFQKGWRQWGLSMQDDLTDAVHWAVAAGIADPNRVAIYGASYGGYAVMMGLAKDPDLYRCGVNLAGVTDVGLMFSVTWSDFAYSDEFKYDAPTLIGDPDKDAAQFKATSPIKNAAKIKRPVLMAYGGDDVRVPIVHGIEMRDALVANKAPVEWVVYDKEGHGLSSPANRADFYRRVEKFLAENMK